MESLKNMKKFGFTLAELLITLGIIGVVAALTAPALYHNAGLAQVGPKLAKVKSTIENANEHMLQDNGFTRITAFIRESNQANQAANDTTQYINQLRNYMRIEDGEAITNFTNYQGTQGNLLVSLANPNVNAPSASRTYTLNAGNIDAFTLRTVEGMALNIAITRNQVDANTGDRPDYVGVILVDINANQNPNRAGKDIFGFIIQDNGMLSPIGSINNDGEVNDTDIAANAGAWTANCNPINGRNVTGNGLTCTASIFENNLKVVYDD